MRWLKRHQLRAPRRWGITLITAVALGQIAFGSVTWAADPAGPGEPQEAWRTSPYHGAISGATGQPIPCLCRYRDRKFNLGEKVCLQMPNGVMLARCDFVQNNTSWVPTDEACTISWRSRPATFAQSFARKS